MDEMILPVPAELLDNRVRAAWYAATPQRVVGKLAHTLAASLPQTTPEGRAAVDTLGRWLHFDANAEDCRSAAEAAWAAAVREWDTAAPLMGTWPTDTEDPRTLGDIAAAAASAVETALPDYPNAAVRADSYAATVLGWPEVRLLLEQAIARGGAPDAEQSAAADGGS